MLGVSLEADRLDGGESPRHDHDSVRLWWMLTRAPQRLASFRRKKLDLVMTAPKLTEIRLQQTKSTAQSQWTTTPSSREETKIVDRQGRTTIRTVLLILRIQKSMR
ncbi:hypothetical protein ACOMHN_017844 [Nucella lapillus]